MSFHPKQLKALTKQMTALFDRDPLRFDESGESVWLGMLGVCAIFLIIGAVGHYYLFNNLSVDVEREDALPNASTLDLKKLNQVLLLYTVREQQFTASLTASTSLVDPSF